MASQFSGIIVTEPVPTPSGGNATCEWTDLNGDMGFPWGEQRRLVSTSVRTSGEWDPSQIVDPNLTNPDTNSYNLGIEYEIVKNRSLAVTGVDKRDRIVWGLLTPAVPESAYVPIQAPEGPRRAPYLPGRPNATVGGLLVDATGAPPRHDQNALIEADSIVVAGNPLDDMEGALKRVTVVIKGGVRYT